MSKPHTEILFDDWGLCPQCGEEELYSRTMLGLSIEGKRPTLEEALSPSGVIACHHCTWSSADGMFPEYVARIKERLRRRLIP